MGLWSAFWYSHGRIEKVNIPTPADIRNVQRSQNTSQKWFDAVPGRGNVWES